MRFETNDNDKAVFNKPTTRSDKLWLKKERSKLYIL